MAAFEVLELSYQDRVRCGAYVTCSPTWREEDYGAATSGDQPTEFTMSDVR
jgi:hypothetical protein